MQHIKEVESHKRPRRFSSFFFEGPRRLIPFIGWLWRCSYGDSLTHGGAVAPGARYAAGPKGKRSVCVTRHQSVTTPVSLSTHRLLLNISVLELLDVISETWPKSGGKDERSTVYPRHWRRQRRKRPTHKPRKVGPGQLTASKLTQSKDTTS